MTFKADSPLVKSVIEAKANEIGSVRSLDKITLIVLHETISKEISTGAEGNANYFHNGSGGRSASAHYVSDNDSTVQCVPENRLSWGVIGYNTWAIHIEQVGPGTQTPKDWDDAYSHAMIYGQVVPLIKDICARRKIPKTFLTVPQLIVCIKTKTVPHGITTHANCTAAAKATKMPNSGHTDPVNYPITAVMNAIK